MAGLSPRERAALLAIVAASALAGIANYGGWAAVPRFALATVALAGVMRFSKRLPRDTATLLQVTVFIIVLLGLSVSSSDPASHHVKAISIVGAVCLLLVYLFWVVPYLRADAAARAQMPPEQR